MMASTDRWIRYIASGYLDREWQQLYLLHEKAMAPCRLRYQKLVEAFEKSFGASESSLLFSAPGRTEIGGNHTDHQHGHVLAASIDLDTIACAAPNNKKVISVVSEGYPIFCVDLEDLCAHQEERGCPAALVRGMAKKFRDMGAALQGFNVSISSRVPKGSGLSSSAAFEVLFGNIMNEIFCGGTIKATEIAAAAHDAENIYFGKPCGLMDQITSAVGGVVGIDFKTPEKPDIQKIDFDFSQSGYSICIVDTGGDHSDLTADYAAVTAEMCSVAGFLGYKVLQQVPEQEFWDSIGRIRNALGDRAVLRAIHYFAEDRRAVQQAEALKRKDWGYFLKLVTESGRSSCMYLQNAYSQSSPKNQGIMLALALCERLLKENGAFRVHGGGFAGTIQAFVPMGLVERFYREMEYTFGSGCCNIISIRSAGGIMLGK